MSKEKQTAVSIFLIAIGFGSISPLNMAFITEGLLDEGISVKAVDKNSFWR